jgi:hypothetical protein
VWKHYTDFEWFRDGMLRSKRLAPHADGLPGKHGVRSTFRKAIQGASSKSELRFQQERMHKLEVWLRGVCAVASAEELALEDSANQFLELTEHGIEASAP